jgi:hypothetical protein
MTDRPIIFSGAMIRALLAGCKTQTRRVLKPQPEIAALASEHLEDHELRGWECIEQADGQFAIVKRQRFQPGDRLWVRENWSVKRHEPCLDHERDWQSLSSPAIRYTADGAERPPTRGDRKTGIGIYHGTVEKGRPSIHMPRWASRLTLFVYSVKVERLLDISEADAQAEGVDPVIDHGVGNPNRHTTAFLQLWDRLHGDGATYANPWVVALTFGVAPANIDSIFDR